MDASPAEQNAFTLKKLHVPGNPVIFANVYDIESAEAVISLRNPETGEQLAKAIATTSWGIACKVSVYDEDLTLHQNLEAISEISDVVRVAGLPLTIDLQDGYDLPEAMKSAIESGVVGANIEDSFPKKGFGEGFGGLRTLEQAVERIRTAMDVAMSLGVPDFVINARTDVMRLTPIPEGCTREMLLNEAIKRGKEYLNAGATCVFVWGGAAGNITNEEIKKLVTEFGGRLAVKLADSEDGLSVKQLANLGVCRVSIGGSLYKAGCLEELKVMARRVLEGGQLRASTHGQSTAESKVHQGRS